jgi:drug/metabolite transporter (DMT)-like permease
MLNSSIPVLIIVLGALFFGERVSLMQSVGVVISLGGVLTIVARGHPQTLLSMGFNAGDLIVLGSMLLWALYTLLLKWRPDEIAPLALLAVCGVIGIVAMTPAFAWELAAGAKVQWSWPVVAAIAYVGVFPSVVGYIFWNRGVQEVGPNVAGLFVHLMPMFGSLLSWQFLGEQLFWFHLAGIALILCGIGLTSHAAAKPAMPAGEE